MKFLAAVLEKQQAPLALRVLEAPPNLFVGQVLVRVLYSGICGSQLNEIAGIKGPDKFLPHLLGHEGGVEIIACGPGVRNVKPGDHAVLHWRKGAGIECEPPRYWCPDTQSEVGGGWATSFNEMSVVSENRLTRVHPEFPLDAAALFGCAVTTGLGVVTNEACVKIGESVMVFGCGGVGLNVIQGCSLAGAYPIIGIDIKAEKLQQALVMGATHVCTPGDLIASERTDVAVDTTGNPDVMNMAWKHANRVCLVAQIAHNQVLPLQTTPMQGGRQLFGSDGGGTNPTEEIPRYVRLWQAGRLNTRSLITHRIRLSQINDVLDDIRACKVGRAVIEM